MSCLESGVETSIDLLHARIGPTGVDDAERPLAIGELGGDPLPGQLPHQGVVEGHLEGVLLPAAHQFEQMTGMFASFACLIAVAIALASIVL